MNNKEIFSKNKRTNSNVAFKKIKTEKVYIKIIKQIRKFIKEGKLKSGDRLPTELELALQFGISRPSVREALCALEILGITEKRGNRGNFIKSNRLKSSFYEQQIREFEEEESPFELLEARKALEAGIVFLASQKASREDIITIEKSLSKMKANMDNIPKMMEFDREFHLNIARAAHNSFLLNTMLIMNNLLKQKLWISIEEKQWILPGYPQKYLEEHNNILYAIKNRDSKNSIKAMHDHLTGVEKDMLK